MITRIPQWTVYETGFTSQRDYDNPLWDVDVRVEFTAPSGKTVSIDAFWNGARAWRARFSPDELGDWRWRSVCSDTANAGLHDRTGTFRGVEYKGRNPLYRHGPLAVSANGHTLAHHDGTPFFWLADTAWNGVLRARLEDWQRYAQVRRGQGFTVVQVVSTEWRGGAADAWGQTACEGAARIRLNPAFFQRADPKIAALNQHGLIATPVLLWALQGTDPGQRLPEADAIRLARYLVARWGAYQVVWFLGGDGHYQGERAARWQRIGRAVFGDRHDRLVTMHPAGQTWVRDEFAGEPWFDFVGYQSGHGDHPEELRWLVEGPPACDWDADPPLPVINLEPNYETHPAYRSSHEFADYEVRRAAYWSLLVAPTAGVTFGHNAIWVWRENIGPAEGHENLPKVLPWHTGLETAGVRSMIVLRRLFGDLWPGDPLAGARPNTDPLRGGSLPWWRLRPAPGLLVDQPGRADPRQFIAAACTDDQQTAVVYLPDAERVSIRTGAFGPTAAARWFDPRSGALTDAGPILPSVTEFITPGAGDWVLVIAPDVEAE